MIALFMALLLIVFAAKSVKVSYYVLIFTDVIL